MKIQQKQKAQVLNISTLKYKSYTINFQNQDQGRTASSDEHYSASPRHT